ICECVTHHGGAIVVPTLVPASRRGVVGTRPGTPCYRRRYGRVRVEAGTNHMSAMTSPDHWAQLRAATRGCFSNAPDGATRATLEGYFEAIDTHLEHEELDEALQLSAALPKICSALEHPRLMTST